jgi:hypothetical protein
MLVLVNGSAILIAVPIVNASFEDNFTFIWTVSLLYSCKLCFDS